MYLQRTEPWAVALLVPDMCQHAAGAPQRQAGAPQRQAGAPVHTSRYACPHKPVRLSTQAEFS